MNESPRQGHFQGVKMLDRFVGSSFFVNNLVQQSSGVSQFPGILEGSGSFWRLVEFVEAYPGTSLTRLLTNYNNQFLFVYDMFDLL